jgi:hypothetical protein
VVDRAAFVFAIGDEESVVKFAYLCLVLWAGLLPWEMAAEEAPVVFEPAPRRIVSGRDPQIAVRASGELFLVKAEGGNLWLHISHDGGDSFEEGVRVNDVEGEVSSQAEASPLLVVRGMHEFYVLWQSRGAGATKLRFARSMDWGKSFSKAIDVDPQGIASQSFFTMGVSPQGIVHVAWIDGRDRETIGGPAVYLARSSGHGGTFEKSVRVNLDAKAEVCPCCRPSIGFSKGGAVHVSWRAVFDNNVRDFVVASSADGGRTWGTAVRVAEDNWSINGCPHSGSSMATLRERLFITWYTIREDRSEINLAYSDDGGRSFSSRQSLSGGLLDPNHPVLFAADDRIVSLFQARDARPDGVWGKIAAFYREVDRDGRLSAPVRVGQLAGSASYPTLAWEGPERLFVVWTESSAQGPGIVMARGRRIVSSNRADRAGANASGARREGQDAR